MATPYFIRTVIKKTFSGRFLISRLSRLPVLGRLIEYILFEGDHIIYLPKNNSLDINVSVKSTDNLVLPTQIIEHFIRKSKFRWKMDQCLCRDSSHCKDYPVDLGCLFLGDAAMGINPKFGRPVSIEEAVNHLNKCQEAGLVHLIGRNKLDTVWLNIGPGQKLLTICHCCPCCCLWKVLPVITEKISSKVQRIPGVTVKVSDKCKACGTCTDGVCFVNAIRLGEKSAVIDNSCRGCGRCVTTCPNKAIDITIADPDYINNSIEKISGLVDVT